MGDMKKAFALTPNALRKGGAQNYAHISPLTKTSKNPTKIWKL
jgi:hypothetical protein